jgi:hypothetical protein
VPAPDWARAGGGAVEGGGGAGGGGSSANEPIGPALGAPGEVNMRRAIEEARAREGGSWEYVVRDEEREEEEDFDDGCGAHAHSIYSHFMYEAQAARSTHGCVQRSSQARKGVGTQGRSAVHPWSYSRSAVRQQQILTAVQAESPFCWQPLPKGSAVIDTWTSAVANLLRMGRELVCIAKRCAVAVAGTHTTKIGLELRRFHESHSRPEATALMWTENEASKFCHPVSYAGKSGTERRAVSCVR